MSDLAIIVPTRSRPRAVMPLVEAFAATCTSDTWLVFAVDGCPQAFVYQSAVKEARDIYPGILIREGPRRRLVGTLNHIATQIAAEPPYAIGYMGDDHRPRTKGWDTAYIDALQDLGTGLVYGDDGLQGENLPTQVAITSDIITALGYMAPPCLTHMYCDNFWLDLGRGAESITYLPDVTIEHCHPATGATPWDDSYWESNSAGSYARDRDAYMQFRASGALEADVEKVRALRERS